jgi:hypothetical protein
MKKTVPAIVSDPSRLHVVVFGATSKLTEPLPDPAAPLVTVIHALLLAAVHGQPAGAVTAPLPVPPDAVNHSLAVETARHEFAAWLTVKVLPATVSEPVRLDPVLGATSKLIVPLPDPAAPLVTVIHTLLLTAVQGQPATIVTVALPVPPVSGND